MDYAELHCLTNFSFLKAASHPEELVQQAHALNYSALAITDECSLAGIVKAYVEAKKLQLKLIIGSEFNLVEGYKVIILATNRRAYAQLSELITRSRMRAEKGSYKTSLGDLSKSLDQCLLLWPSDQLGPNDKLDIAELLNVGAQLRQYFYQRLWLVLENNLENDYQQRLALNITLAKQLNLPMVACGNVLMHQQQRKPLLDALHSIQLGKPIAELAKSLICNAQRYLRSLDDIAKHSPPSLVQESLYISSLCQFSLAELRYEYPKELVPPGQTATTYLRQLCYAGVHYRWPHKVPEKINTLLEKELRLITELHYEYYFLTVYDIVNFARSENILCQGRGSAANSVVCYCLNITEVDPASSELLFERFISKERNEPPDIDVDFEHERREEVIQYIYRKYGRDRAAIAATVVTYRPRSAIRDVGKALGFDLGLVEKLAKTLSWWDKKEVLSQRFIDAGVDPNSHIIQLFIDLINQILRFPRHLSQHVGGFIISAGPLSQLVPVENAAMPDRSIIQWDKDDLEQLGLLKMDVLALGMLSAISKSLNYISSIRPQALSLASIPKEDPKVYQLLQQGDSVGIFQVESRAQMAMLPRLKPACFYDLVIEVAIVRPGPIQGNMVHPYLKRRQGLEDVHYPSDEVKAVLERTLGIPIFQEQVIKLAMVAAGFSAGEADGLRRAMASWRRSGELHRYEKQLVKGMVARGHGEEFAHRLCEQIKGFGEYGFPESHAASFSLLVYASAWLKRHEPAAFYCGLLNSQPMGFYSPSQLVQDAQRHGLTILPVDIQHSTWEHFLDTRILSKHADTQSQAAIRLGFRLSKGLGQNTAIKIEQARQQQPFSGLVDLSHRAGLSQSELQCLTQTGALKNLSGDRHQSHWQILGLEAPLGSWQKPQLENDKINLSQPSEVEDLQADYQSLGLTLGRHPMAILRAQKKYARCRSAAQLLQLNNRRLVRIAGIVTGRQRPGTASGVLFMTVEDETGNANVVIWQSTQERFRLAVLKSRLVLIKGIMERKDKVVHVIAATVEDCSDDLRNLRAYSRDFR